MFINFWYVAEESTKLTNAPSKVRMLGQDFVLFRDSKGKAHCLSNVCVHRGASLGNGKVKGDCVECPYHGWQYDGSGICQRIPSMGSDAKIPGRARIDSYPTEEKYDLIFVFLGDLPENQRPPIMDIPEWGQDGWRWTFVTFNWQFNYRRAVENILDPAHTEFVHPMMGYQGARDDYVLPNLELQESEWGVGTSFVNESSTQADSMKSSVRKGEGQSHSASAHHGPTNSWISIGLTQEASLQQYAFVTPIDENNSRRFFYQARNFMMDPKLDQSVEDRMVEIAKQDSNVVGKILPPLSPETTTREVLVPSDTVIARYREKLKAWQANGWRIDMDKVNESGEAVAYAIPSPARRSHKGWALDSVPLVPVETGATDLT